MLRTPGVHHLDPLEPTATRTAAVALLLHGGSARPGGLLDARRSSRRWTAALQRAVTPALHEEGVATWLLRHRAAGCDGGAEAVAEARAALAEVRAAHGRAPVVLVAHSTGARTAVAVADDPAVAGVVALAPRWPVGQPVRPLAGRWVVAVLGRRDRAARAGATRDLLDRAAAVARGTDLHDLGTVGPRLGRGPGAWHDVAVTGVLDALA